MNNKYYLICIIFILIVFAFFSYYEYASSEKAKLKIGFKYYEKLLESEQEWIANLQLSNGALPLRKPADSKKEGEVIVIPYFSCISVLALLEPEGKVAYGKVVKDYFDWHFNHLNDADNDIYGVSGTIYDYQVFLADNVVQWETTEKKYDSTDSYAALYLIALWKYYYQTGDSAYLLEHYLLIKDVVGAMNATIDKDGLSFAKPNFQTKYLMDNVEVVDGVSSAINIFENVFLRNFDKETKEYKSTEEMLLHLKEIKKIQEQSFNETFWNEEDERFEIGINKDGLPIEFNGWTKFYPDAVAQLFPIIYGLVEPDSEKARQLYTKFCEHHSWEKMGHLENSDNSFYWGLTAYCGALMRDEEKVSSYLDHFNLKVFPDYDYPAYNADVAWVAIASAEMARYYQSKMKKLDPLGIIK